MKKVRANLCLEEIRRIQRKKKSGTHSERRNQAHAAKEEIGHTPRKKKLGTRHERRN